MNKRAIVHIQLDAVIDALKDRRSEVFAHPLPADARVVDVRYINSAGVIVVEVESETFAELSGKAKPPILPTPRLQVVLDDEASSERNASPADATS
jgi:hypothetical protein